MYKLCRICWNLYGAFLFVRTYLSYSPPLHRLYPVARTWYDWRRVLLFDELTIYVMTGVFLIHMVIGMLKNIGTVDKYLSRSTVYFILASISLITGYFSHGWLLDYVARFLMLISFISALYAAACTIMAFISIIYNLKKD